MIVSRKAKIEDQFRSPYTSLFQAQKQMQAKRFSEIAHKPVIAEAVKAPSLEMTDPADKIVTKIQTGGHNLSQSGATTQPPSSSFSKTVGMTTAKDRRMIVSAGGVRRLNANFHEFQKRTMSNTIGSGHR